MPNLDYRALRAQIPIQAVLELMNYVPLRIRGDQWRGPCPLHGDSAQNLSESCFAVNVRKHVFFCHRCRRGGNQLDLWAAATQLPLYQAALDLCQRLRLDPPLLPSIRNPKTPRPEPTPPQPRPF